MKQGEVAVSSISYQPLHYCQPYMLVWLQLEKAKIPNVPCLDLEHCKCSIGLFRIRLLQSYIPPMQVAKLSHLQQT